MKTWLPGIILLALTGCVTTYFKTNTDYNALHRFSRILVVSKLPKVPSTYLTAWLSAFPDQYDVCVVDASELSFGNPDSLINQEAQKCRSEVMLTLDFNRNYTAGAGKYIYSTSEVSLQMATLPDRKPFWKALATQDVSREDIQPRQVVKQLITDAIIEGKVPPATY